MAINRHLHIQQQQISAVRRKLFVQLTTIVLLVGLIPGIFSRFDISAEYAIRKLNEGLQNIATDPSLEVRFPITKVPALKNHFGMNYILYARPSTALAGALEITILFADGYTLTCLVPTTSGDATYLQICNEGAKIIFP